MSSTPPEGTSPAAVAERGLVVAARADGAALGALFDRWFTPSYDHALGIVRTSGPAAEIARTAFESSWADLDGAVAEADFGPAVLFAARAAALTRVEARPVSDDDVESTADLAVFGEVDSRREVVRGGALVLGAADFSLLDLHVRHGVRAARIADHLGIQVPEASERLFALRAALKDAIAASVLWNSGYPACARLVALVAPGAGLNTETVAAVTEHRAMCATCSQSLGRQFNPERLFAELPLAVAPKALVERLRSEVLGRAVSPPIALVEPGPAVEPAPAPAPARSRDELATPVLGVPRVVVAVPEPGLVLAVSPPTTPPSTDAAPPKTGAIILREQQQAWILASGQSPPQQLAYRGRVRPAVLLAALCMGLAVVIAVGVLLSGVLGADAGTAADGTGAGLGPTGAPGSAAGTLAPAGSSGASRSSGHPGNGTTTRSSPSSTLRPSGHSSSPQRSTTKHPAGSTTISTTAGNPAGAPLVTLSIVYADKTSSLCTGGRAAIVAWTISGATEAVLTLADSQTAIKATNGSATSCLKPKDVVTVSASGAGGTTAVSAGAQ